MYFLKNASPPKTVGRINTLQVHRSYDESGYLRWCIIDCSQVRIDPLYWKTWPFTFDQI